MKVEPTRLDQVFLIRNDIFKDHRGEYVEMYNEEGFIKNEINLKFVQDDVSVSNKNVLRGIHGDFKTHKLIGCLWGEFYLVIVDCRGNQPTFGTWQSFNLSDKSKDQVLVPPGFGVGHLALTDKIIFFYKQTTYYDPSSQFTYKWNEPKFNISWPINNPILSKRDEQARYD